MSRNHHELSKSFLKRPRDINSKIFIFVNGGFQTWFGNIDVGDRMLECVVEKFEMLVTDSVCWWPIWYIEKITNITKKVANLMILLPTSQISHYHKVTNITMSPLDLRNPKNQNFWKSEISQYRKCQKKAKNFGKNLDMKSWIRGLSKWFINCQRQFCLGDKVKSSAWGTKNGWNQLSWEVICSYLRNDRKCSFIKQF